MKSIYYSESVEETERIAADLAQKLPECCFIAFFGGLGMGKTAFTRGLASVLVPDARVTSPTYTVVNVYHSKTKRINHFDLYRITDEDGLESVGFYDYLPTGITVCEWCENVPFALPDKYCRVEFKRVNEDKREIEISLIGVESYADLRY